MYIFNIGSPKIWDDEEKRNLLSPEVYYRKKIK